MTTTIDPLTGFENDAAVPAGGVLAELRGAVTPRRAGMAAAGLVGAYVLLEVLLPLFTVKGGKKWESPPEILVLGLIIGLTYGLLAVGLVLIYRSNRIINFAHGQVGAFGAAFFGIAVTKWHIPYYVALVPALAVAAGAGAVTETAVVRRLRKAPPLMSIVATIGIGQFLVILAFLINGSASATAKYPRPPYIPEFAVGSLQVKSYYVLMLVGVPIVVTGIGLFLKLSRFGLAIRAAAANPDAALMTGVFASRMSTLVWGIAGSVAAFAAILQQPTRGFTSADGFGPSLLLVALTGAVLARMQSLPLALFWGTVLGMIEQLLLWNFNDAGLVQMAFFVIILVGLLGQKNRVGRSEEKGSWAAVQSIRPLPAAIRQVRSVRLVAPVTAVAFFALLALLPLFISNSQSTQTTGVFAIVIIGLSVGVVTGLGGQLSLGQFAIASVGAVVSFQVSKRSGDFGLAFLYAGVASAVVSVVIGLPALKVKGLLLTVTTLAFALVMPGYLLKQGFLLGDGPDPGKPIIFGKRLETGHSYYYVALAVLLVAVLLARNIRNGGIGRRLVAVRDNEDAARAFTVPATAVKLQGFALAGFIAGLAGAMYGHSLTTISASSFPTETSITAVVLAVVGGIGLLSGPILGALVLQGFTYLPLDSAELAATSLGQLLIILYLPSGLGGLVTPIRARITGFLARRAGVDVEAAYAGERGFNASGTGGGGPLPGLKKHDVTAGTGPMLEISGIVKSFGGVRAVRGVSFTVQRGETLGLIGPNGAGKTTTFELVAGFTNPDQGRVRFLGRDVTRLSPEARGRLGLIRSFQDAALFPTLTVRECVELALERVHPTRLVPSLLGLKGAEKRKQRRADELVAWMGLERYKSSQIQELSTGTRRITEIACLVALEPTLLLLDEPSSGVAQKESEALALLLERLKAQLGLTLVIIEHDIPMIMALSDRIVCMADGEVIAAGSPEMVRNDPKVVEAYLGGSITAIERSATGSTPAPAVVPPDARDDDTPTPRPRPRPSAGPSPVGSRRALQPVAAVAVTTQLPAITRTTRNGGRP